MNSNFLVRLRFVGGVVILIALLIFAKLFFVQILHHANYSNEALSEYTSQGDSVYDRGTIYFTSADGTLIPAATLAVGYKLILIPKSLKPGDADTLYTELNQYVPLDKDMFMSKAAKTDSSYQELADQLSEDVKNKITLLNLSSVRLETEKWRYYPGNTLASQTLGFVGYTGDDLVGEYGLEREYNDVLSRSKADLYVNFFAELFTNLHKTLFQDPHAEGDIVTTIEPEVQHTLETTLGDIMTKWQTEKAGGIIIDPKTGDILAMGSLPDFDPNNFSSVKDLSVFTNPNIENDYELGSIIKSLTMSAGIDSGSITTDTTYMDPGCMTINTEHICNFDRKARGKTTMQTIFDQSLNMGATFIEQKTGKDTFRKYFYNFGVNQKTGVDMPNEIQSLVSNLQSTRDIEYATASFGQGIALTPVAAVRAFSALANGGMTVAPRVVKDIQYADGFSRAIDHPAGVQVIKPETALTVTRMLVKTVDTALVGGTLKLDHYSVAAKTGTAQMALENGRGYYPDKYLHSMFGYYPAYNPRFLVLLYIINPHGANFSNQTFSAQTLGEPFMNLAKFLTTYYDVAPDR